MKRSLYAPEHEDFRSAVADFADRVVAPRISRWDEAGLVDREAWVAAGELGLIGVAVPTQYGGDGVTDFRYRMIVMEELCRIGAGSFNAGLSVQEDLVLPYLLDLGTEEQRSTWLPRLCGGTAIGALALTEPGAGSDLRSIRTTARRDGDGWFLNGSKLFITNGIQADVVVVLSKIEPWTDAGDFAIFLVPADRIGFGRGRRLDKVGLRGSDTAELFFHDVVLSDADLLGTPGRGLAHVMERLPRERLSIAATSVAAATAVYEWTRVHCFERHAAGRPVGELQATRFALAEIETELDAATSLVDRAVRLLDEGQLSAVDAAKAKWWVTDLHQRVVDSCLQLHGTHAYLREHPIGRAYVDARVQRIYGGTNEIMKDLVGRDIAARTHRRQQRA